MPFRLLAAGIPPSPLASAQLTVLPNGLRVIVLEQHSAPLAAVDVWVRAGSGRERAGESGAAHFLEHALFKGTATRKPGEVDLAIEDLGAVLSAGTTRDAAHFYTTVASQYAGTALDVIADVLRNAALAPEEVERERAVILDEMATGRADTAKQVVNALYDRLAANSPYGNPILGRQDSLRALPRETIAAFYRRWYLPNNTTVVVVGDVAADAAVGMVSKAFGAWSRGDLPSSSGDVAARPYSSTSTPSLPARMDGKLIAATGYAIPAPKGLGDICSAMLVRELLADETVGRIPQALREEVESASAGGTRPARPGASGIVKKDWLAGLDADYTPLRESSVLAISAAVDPDQAAHFYKLVSEAVRRLQQVPVARDEMDYAKRHVIGAFLFETETFGGEARALGSYDMLGNYGMAGQLVDAVNSVKASDISALCAALEPGRRADVTFVPERK